MNVIYFVFFFVFCSFLYFKVKTIQQQKIILIVLSCSIYYMVCGIGCIILLLIAIFIWFAGRYLYYSRNKIFLSASVSLLLLVMFVFSKYSISNYFGKYDGLALIVGLSFYSMQAVSYLIDIYRGNSVGTLIDVVFYISFFGTCFSGPIIKWHDAINLYNNIIYFSIDRLKIGFYRITYGIFKKKVVADRLGVAVCAVYSAPSEYSWITLLLIVFSYGIELYADFLDIVILLLD